jgi:hypothetical protein
MGTFICGRCKKEWSDVAYFCCPECHPRWALFLGILAFSFFCGFLIAALAGFAWLAGWLS